MKLEVHGLHDDAHAALAEHPFDPVPARKNGTDLDPTVIHHGLLCAMLHAATATITPGAIGTSGLRIVRSFGQVALVLQLAHTKP
jgi:hypothetical protein